MSIIDPDDTLLLREKGFASSRQNATGSGAVADPTNWANTPSGMLRADSVPATQCTGQLSDRVTRRASVVLPTPASPMTTMPPTWEGVIYLSPDAAWGRIAHEIGHWLGMWDIYKEWYSDGTYIPGTAAPWCLSGLHDLEPLWCAHQIHEKMAVYGTTPPNINVVDLQWSPTAPATDHVYEVIAHEVNEDADPNPDRVHLLKLRVADGLWYFVEVRQRPAGLVFDQQRPPFPGGASGVVLVTRVFEGTSISNTRERPIEVFEILTAGQQAVDAARNLIIRHDGVAQDQPQIARVRVQWNQPVPGDPNGQFDMSITPWDTTTWETVDVWVDSPRNNSVGTVIYENHQPGQPGQPILNGDRPWVHHPNKIFARIRNTGPVAVPDVYVTCYVTSPRASGITVTGPPSPPST